MRKALLLISLLVISCASALTIDVNTIDTSLTGLDNLTINYVINLDQTELTDYEILLRNEYNEFLIYNETLETKDLDETITYNVSSIASGTYTIVLRLNQPLTYSALSDDNVTIQRDFNLMADVPNTVYTPEDSIVIEVPIYNDGNTDMTVSAFFRNAKADVTISPQSFPLERGSNKTMMITFTKPTNSYETTFVIYTFVDGEETRYDYPIRVIIPLINLTMSEARVSETTNETIINTLINNTGNMDVDATINIRTFSILEGFKIEQENITFNAGESIDYSRTLPKKSLVSISLVYGNTTLTQELSALNAIPFDFKLSRERLVLIGVLIAVIVIIIYFKFFKRRRRP